MACVSVPLQSMIRTYFVAVRCVAWLNAKHEHATRQTDSFGGERHVGCCVIVTASAFFLRSRPSKGGSENQMEPNPPLSTAEQFLKKTADEEINKVLGVPAMFGCCEKICLSGFWEATIHGEHANMARQVAKKKRRKRRIPKSAKKEGEKATFLCSVFCCWPCIPSRIWQQRFRACFSCQTMLAQIQRLLRSLQKRSFQTSPWTSRQLSASPNEI